MKKLIALLLCLMMVLPAFALAETAADAAEYATYEAMDGTYQFVYPSAWTAIDKETIGMLLDTVNALGNEELSTMITNVRGQVETMGIVMLLSETYQANVTVAVVDAGVEISDEVLGSMTETVKAQLSAQLSGIAFDEESTGVVTTLPAGSALPFFYEYSIAGQNLGGAMYYIAVGSKLYTFTLTAPAASLGDYAEDFGVMMGSLAIQ